MMLVWCSNVGNGVYSCILCLILSLCVLIFFILWLVWCRWVMVGRSG